MSWCNCCCSYGNEQIQVHRSGGCERDRWRCGRVARARVDRYVLWQRVSGQVDSELTIDCQIQDLCRRVWKVPVCLVALPSASLSLPFLSASFCLEAIVANRWWPRSLRPSAGIKILEIWRVSTPEQSVYGFIKLVFTHCQDKKHVTKIFPACYITTVVTLARMHQMPFYDAAQCFIKRRTHRSIHRHHDTMIRTKHDLCILRVLIRKVLTSWFNHVTNLKMSIG